MVWTVLICVVVLAVIVLGSVWLGHFITMRAFSYQHPMTGSMDTAKVDEPGVMYYEPDESQPEEPDTTLQAYQSLEKLKEMGVDPADALGPNVQMYASEGEEEDNA